MCCAPNVYMFVYTLIGVHIVPLSIVVGQHWNPYAPFNIHQLDVNFLKLTTYFEHLTSNQDTETDSLIPEDFTLESIF